jgi:hypothetical protein
MYLYKYRSLRGDARAFTERTVAHRELYFPTPDRFNDPFESRFVLSLGTSTERVEKLARVIQKTDPKITRDRAVALASDSILRAPATFEADAQARLVDSMRGSIRMFSLAEHPDNILMWSHYADAHRGICLRFESSTCDLLQAAAPVRSSDVAPTLDWAVDDPFATYVKVALTKSKLWAYEAEWRVILHPGQTTIQVLRPQAITGVVFGMETLESDRVAVRNWCDTAGLSIEYFEASREPNQYSIKMLPVRPPVQQRVATNERRAVRSLRSLYFIRLQLSA